MKRRKQGRRLGVALLAALCLSGTGAMTVSAASLPDHIVNGNFSYPSNLNWSQGEGILHKEADWVYVVNGKQYTDQHPEGWSIAGFNQTSFGWKSDQPATDKFPAGVIEMQRSKDGQVYAEMVAENANCAIYQDIQADGDSILYWSLKHAPRGASYDGGDTMSVKIGPPGQESIQMATRTSNNGSGDRVGETMTVIKTTKPNNTTFAPWETYEGRYIVPGTGKKTIRFTFRAGTSGSTGRSGNLLDDIVFTKAYPIDFDSNGGTDIGFNPKANDYRGYFRSGHSVSLSTLTSVKPTREGYTFLGWTTSKRSPVTSKAAYDQVRNSIVTSVTTKNAKTTVYALWAKNPTIKFVSDGSTLSKQTVAFGGSVSTPTTPTKTGYTFTGWSPAIQSQYYSDATITATWRANTYRLTYEKNAESTNTGNSDVLLSKTSQTAKYDSPWGPMATASKPGYTFQGWYTERNGGTQVTSQTICKGDLTVYAKWKPISYTIIFKPNPENGAGTVTGSMPSITVTYDQAINLPANQYQKTTRVPAEDEGGSALTKTSLFKGWSTIATALEPSLKDQAKILNLTSKDGDIITLYAIWDDHPQFIVESYPDRYFTVEEAQRGDITKEELLSTVVVKDRESGQQLQTDVVGYDPEEFRSVTDDSVISTRYEVVDTGNNKSYLNINVYISQEEPLPPELITYFRSIGEAYADEQVSETYGGLAPDSAWRSGDYQAVLQDAFDESADYSLSLNKAKLAQLWEYVKQHGLGNSLSDDALASLWQQLFGN